MTQAMPSASATESANYPRHRWYLFKEAFSPALVEHVIDAEKLKPSSVVIDPFSVSGTTPLRAGLLGMQGIGVFSGVNWEASLRHKES